MGKRSLAFTGALLAGVLSAGVPAATAAPGRSGDATGAANPPGDASAVPARFHDASADKVHASTAIPDPKRKVGEVRLLTRGDAVVVQTLLSTKVLSRVVAEIHKKEQRNWPADGNAATASASYLSALDSAREKVETREPDPGGDRRRRLMIEFAAGTGDAAVLLGTFPAGPGVAAITLREREVFSALHLPRDYILRQIRLILADSFDMNEDEVDRLGPLGPAALAAAPPPDPPAGATPKAPQH